MQIKLSNLSERVSAPYGLVKQIMGHRPTATDKKHDKDRPIDLLRYWHTIADCAISKGINHQSSMRFCHQ